MSETALSPDDRFRRLYNDNFTAILGYALRRAGSAEDAADAVAETFLVAWRRLADVPEQGEARLWLYGVARRVLSNQRRTTARRDQLGERLRRDLAAAVPDHADAVVVRADVSGAVARLGRFDREVLELAGWEGLRPAEIAVVLDVPARTVRTRLSRARARLRAELGDDAWPDGHAPGDPLTAAPRQGKEQ